MYIYAFRIHEAVQERLEAESTSKLESLLLDLDHRYVSIDQCKKKSDFTSVIEKNCFVKLTVGILTCSSCRDVVIRKTPFL